MGQIALMAYRSGARDLAENIRWPLSVSFAFLIMSLCISVGMGWHQKGFMASVAMGLVIGGAFSIVFTTMLFAAEYQKRLMPRINADSVLALGILSGFLCVTRSTSGEPAWRGTAVVCIIPPVIILAESILGTRGSRWINRSLYLWYFCILIVLGFVEVNTRRVDGILRGGGMLTLRDIGDLVLAGASAGYGLILCLYGLTLYGGWKSPGGRARTGLLSRNPGLMLRRTGADLDRQVDGTVPSPLRVLALITLIACVMILTRHEPPGTTFTLVNVMLLSISLLHDFLPRLA